LQVRGHLCTYLFLCILCILCILANPSLYLSTITLAVPISFAYDYLLFKVCFRRPHLEQWGHSTEVRGHLSPPLYPLYSLSPFSLPLYLSTSLPLYLSLTHAHTHTHTHIHTHAHTHTHAPTHTHTHTQQTTHNKPHTHRSTSAAPRSTSH
jgi:hypothetical protein